MKFNSLHLKAFGAFTDKWIELGSTGQHLHLIYGPNEAGKSTTLRAITALLFGIQKSSSDDFRHHYGQMRVGGVLEHSSGETLHIVRRKGNKSTLLTRDEQPLDDTTLERFIPNVGEELFLSLFGLTHSQLVMGGQELLQGKGAIGQALFSAGTGLSGLNQLLQDLEKGADALFKPQGRSGPSLTRLHKELEEKRSEKKRIELRGDKFAENERLKEQAQAALDRTSTELRALETSLRRLERLEQALPLFQLRQHYSAELEQLREVVTLSKDFPQRRAQAHATVEQLTRNIQQLEQALTLTHQALSDVQVPELLLERGADVNRLHIALGEYLKGEKDLPQRKGLLSNEEHRARQILREMGLEPDLKAGRERLEISRAKVDGIHSLARQYQARVDAQRSAERRLLELEDEQTRKRDELAKLPPLQETSQLELVIKQARRAGNLEEEHRRTEEELERCLQQSSLELKRLGLWTGTPEALVEVALPSPERVAQFETRFTRGEVEGQELDKRLQTLLQKRRELEKQSLALSLAGEVPTEADLQQSRALRDQSWTILRRHLEQRDAPLQTTPDDYEGQVLNADQISDRLRREADRVQKKVQLQAELHQCGLEQESLRLAQVQHTATKEQLEREWLEIWHGLDLLPRSPSEMKSWLTRALKLQEGASKPLELTQKRDTLQLRIQEHLERLISQLEHLSLSQPAQPLPTDRTSLETTLLQAEKELKHLDLQREKRAGIELSVSELATKLRSAERGRTEATGDLATWKQQWGDAVKVLGLGPDSQPTEATILLGQADEFLKHFKEADTLRKRIEGLEADGQRFRLEVESLCKQLAPELGDSSLATQPADQAILHLHIRWQEAQKQSTRREELRRKCREQETQLESTRRQLETATTALASCLAEAQCESYSELPELEARSERKRELTRTVSDLNDQLLKTAGAIPLEQWLNEVASSSLEVVKEQLVTAQARKEVLDVERQQHSEVVGRETQILSQYDGSSKASQLNEDAQELLAQMRTQTEQYLSLRLGHALLQHELNVWREQNQTPLVKRASEIFHRLTLERFTGLATDYNNQDMQILVGLRGDERVAVEGMSEGTRDQLYFALRLAGLEQYLHKNEPIPFIVDDVLINFDDARSASTLQVLHALSEKTQVIFFTHHAHLLELASEVLPSGQFQALHLG